MNSQSIFMNLSGLMSHCSKTLILILFSIFLLVIIIMLRIIFNVVNSFFPLENKK